MVNDWKKIFFLRNPGTPSYHMLERSCWTLGWATKDFCLHFIANFSRSWVKTCQAKVLCNSDLVGTYQRLVVARSPDSLIAIVVEHHLKLVRTARMVKKGGREALDLVPQRGVLLAVL